MARGRATASHLSELCPGWVVYYGPASRRYWAFASWHGGPTEPIDAADPHELLAHVREAEQTGAVPVRFY